MFLWRKRVKIGESKKRREGECGCAVKRFIWHEKKFSFKNLIFIYLDVRFEILGFGFLDLDFLILDFHCMAIIKRKDTELKNYGTE